MEVFPSKELPHGLSYPKEYLWLIDQHDTNPQFIKFTPWYFLDAKFSKLRYDRLQKEYPNRRLFAFAARFDNDDIACWEDGKSKKVVIIHDGASGERATRKEFASFWEWFRSAVEDMITFGQDETA